jgi:hypothetical protein
MIKGLTAGNGLVVNGGNTSLPYVNMSNSYGNNSNPMQGMMRINGNDIQVFDGSSWLTLSASYATVELNSETQSLLQWAREQRNKQIERQSMSKSHPAVAKAIEALERAEEQVTLIVELSKDHENNKVYTG